MADLKENTLIMVLLAIFLPPIAVGIKVGFTLHFWINIVLWFTLIGAMIHALIIVLR